MMSRFTEIDSCRLNNRKMAVVSTDENGGFCLAQRLTVEDDNGTKMNIFLKNAIHMDKVTLEDVYKMLGRVLDRISGPSK